MPDWDTKQQRCSLAVKYGAVLFPFDIPAFLNLISNQGYQIPEQLTTAALPLGSTLGVDGVAGVKRGVQLRLHSDRHILGLDAADLDTPLDEMDLVEGMLQSELDFDSPSSAQYYELVTNMTVRAVGNPLDLWYTHLGETGLYQAFASALGTEVAPLGTRLVPPSTSPNTVDWFEIRLEPLLRAATTHHFLQIIFRRSSREETFDFSRRLNTLLEELLAIVEGR